MKKMNKLLTLKSELEKLFEDCKFLSPKMSVEDLLSYIKSSVEGSLRLLKCITTGSFRHQIYQTGNGFLVEGETLKEVASLEEAMKENYFFEKMSFYIHNEFLIVNGRRGEEVYSAPSWVLEEIQEGNSDFLFKNCEEIAYLHKWGNWRVGTVSKCNPKHFETIRTIWRDGSSVSIKDAEEAVERNSKHQELKLVGEKVSVEDIEWDDGEIIQPEGFEILWLDEPETDEEITLRLCKRSRAPEGAYYKIPR